MRWSVFDLIGPVMIGPSSSHTSGAASLGLYVNKIVGGVPDEVKIYLYGSFSQVYKGHGTDRALIGGLLGYKSDDSRLIESFHNADLKRMKYEIIPTGEDHHLHPNTVLFKVRRGSTNFEIVGCSIGGGNIEIHQINGVKIKPLDGKKDVFAIISDTKKDVSRLLNRLSCKYSSIDEYKTLNDKYLYLVHEIKSNSKGIALPGYKYRLISSIL